MGESSELAEKEKGGERELVTDHGKRVQIADGQGRGDKSGMDQPFTKDPLIFMENE